MMTNSKTRTTATTQATTKDALSRTVVYTTAGAAAVIGLWAAACFVGALINVGPLGLVGSWFTAVTGL
jgi:fatty acid desaturase